MLGLGSAGAALYCSLSWGGGGGGGGSDDLNSRYGNMPAAETNALIAYVRVLWAEAVSSCRYFYRCASQSMHRTTRLNWDSI